MKVLTGVQSAVIDSHGLFAFANLADHIEKSFRGTGQLEDHSHDTAVERLAFFEKVLRCVARSLRVPVETLDLNTGRRLAEGKLTLFSFVRLAVNYKTNHRKLDHHVKIP